VQICPNCREENPARFRLCGFCGTALAVAVPVQEIRKTVTIVFSDLKGSTDLGERLDSESLREVMNRYFEAMRVELEAHGGTIEKFIGDAIMAVFGLPTVHEDDALRAVRAADGMRTALGRLNEDLDRRWGVQLAMRIGVHTGEVVAGDPAAGQRLVTGDPVNTAARLEQAAGAGEILIGEITHRLVRSTVHVEPVDPLELKGKAERVPAWRLLSVGPVGGQHATDASPIVGREAELARLRSAFDIATGDRRLRTITIIGDAGVGKSRLVREFLNGIGEKAYAARGRCLPYGQGITFWPVAEIVRQVADIEEEDPPERATAKILGLVGDGEVADRLASAIGLIRTAYPVAELFWAVRRTLEVLAEREPLVLVIDDIHWAEATLLELIEHLSEAGIEAPVLLLCTSRHELLEERPTWGEGASEERIELHPLGVEQAAVLVEALLGRAGLPAVILDRITAAAEGNPLFVEQLVSMLVEEGAIRRVEGDWRMGDEVGPLSIPATIHALLAARIDRLGREERALLEPASVIGLVFPLPALRFLAPETPGDDLDRHLGALDRKQLVHPVVGATDIDPMFRFHHILIRDTSYNSLLKRTRATLHERFVEWADARNADSDRALEFEEILGYHLEQAYRYLSELGPLDDDGVRLGIRASQRLASAGRRAFARGDMPATANLLRRAALARPVDDAERIALLALAGEAFTETGEIDTANDTLEMARTEARRMGDPALEARATLGLIFLHYLTGTGLSERGVISEVEANIKVLETTHDERGLMQAWRILTNVHFAGCRWLDATQTVEQAVEHARRAGDHAMELRMLTGLAGCAQMGPTPVPEAIALVEDVLARVRGDRKSEAYTMRLLANLEAMRGRFADARSLYRRSRETLEQLGWRFDAALTSSIASGRVELIAGDPVAAEAELRRDHDALAAMGERNFISTNAAYLAEALYRQGKEEEAMAMTEESESIADAEDVTTQYLWRTVRAKLLARRGRTAEAEGLGRAAIAIIESAQDPDSQGYAWLDLAEVLAMDGRAAEAIEAAEVAIHRFDTKANSESAARARGFRDDLGVS
jgi:class 3 adenylate cyclase/tetratricopeptide (TPR) repeat protein